MPQEDTMNTETKTVTNSFCWAELATSDLAAAKAFYAQLHGWNFTDMETPGGPYVLIEPGSGHGGGMMPLMPDMRPAWMPYVQVTNLEATLARSEAAGGKTLMPPHELGDGAGIAWLQDPEGARLGLYRAGEVETDVARKHFLVAGQSEYPHLKCLKIPGQSGDGQAFLLECDLAHPFEAMGIPLAHP